MKGDAEPIQSGEMWEGKGMGVSTLEKGSKWNAATKYLWKSEFGPDERARCANPFNKNEYIYIY